MLKAKLSSSVVRRGTAPYGAGENVAVVEHVLEGDHGCASIFDHLEADLGAAPRASVVRGQSVSMS